MVIDTLENIALYYPLHEDLRTAAEFLLAFTKSPGELRRYDLNDRGLYVNAETYTTQPEEGREAEAHRQYVDVQYVLSGRERIGVAPLARMKSIGAFQPESDIGFYTGACTQWADLTAGSIAILWPHEAHLPGTQLGDACKVVKLVAKLPLFGTR